MRVLEEKADLNYLQAICDDEDADVFRARLIKSGGLAGVPILLSDGRRVGTVLSGGAWPSTFTADDEVYEDGAAVIEMQFDSAAFMKSAREAELTLEDGAVVLLGDQAGDRPHPVEKSADAQMHAELRAGWGLA